MVTSMPAAPLNGPAVLPDALIDQYVKPAGADQAALLDTLRLTAIRWVEGHTSHSLQRRRWVAMFDGFAGGLRLPCGPVRSVLSLGYVDTAGVPVEATGAWQLSGSYLLPASGGRWPGTASRSGVVTVAYEAGFDDLAAEAPALQIAALMMTKHLFDGGSINDVPTTIGMLIDEQYRTPVMR